MASSSRWLGGRRRWCRDNSVAMIVSWFATVFVIDKEQIRIEKAGFELEN